MKNLKIPHTFTIVFGIIIICAVLTWIVSGGQFARQIIETDGSQRSIVVADSFQIIEHEPQTWQIFTAFFQGFARTAEIIVFILIIGGAFWIMNSTKAIDYGIFFFLKTTQKLQNYRILKKIGIHNMVISSIMILFSLFGAVFGMSEETIAFIIVFVPLSISMGYDSITGVLMCYVAAHVGFAAAMLNPFTIGIAQGLSGLPAFSGIEYRFLCWLFLTLLAIVFTLLYAARVKKKPEQSPMYQFDQYWRTRSKETCLQLETSKSSWATWFVYGSIALIFLFCSIRTPYSLITIGGHSCLMLIFPVLFAVYLILGFLAVRKSAVNFILIILLFTIIMLIVGVLAYQWYIKEIAALFLGMGLAAGFAYKMGFDRNVRLFLEGCKDIMVAALVVGMAGGIIVILENGKIIDTILYTLSQSMTDRSKEEAIGAMYLIQTVLNIIIPSGSAKAALTIPMMVEFSDIIGVSRQLTVLAFQFGDGFTNMITPASGVLIGALGAARIPYAKWLRFIWKFILGLILIGLLLLLIPLIISFPGF